MESHTLAIDLDPLIAALAAEPITLPTECQTLNSFQWAGVFESLTNDQRIKLWAFIPTDLQSTVLSVMREDARNQFISVLPQQVIAEAISSATNAEVMGILDVLPKRAAAKLVNKLDPAMQSYLETSLSYTSNEVGRYANANVYTVNEKASVKDLINEIKSTDITNDGGSYFVVNDNFMYIGEVKISDILNSSQKTDVKELVVPNEQVILDRASLLEASDLVRGSNKAALPIVTKTGLFLGQFSIHDALDVFQEHYEEQLAHMGKVSDEDLFAPVAVSARRRAVWLGINLITAFMASFVIGIFDKVLIEVVALAVLMPIVASMGGITGSQTLTLTIRGLATGQLGKGNFKVLRSKELKVAAINGVLWAVLVTVVTMYWFDNPGLSSILALAMVVNMTVASFAGIMIPMILDKLGIDPALAGSVILTTVTDVVGFFVFLGSATLLFIS